MEPFPQTQRGPHRVPPRDDSHRSLRACVRAVKIILGWAERLMEEEKN